MNIMIGGAVVGMVISCVIISPLLGAFCGWLLGWIFDDTFDTFLKWAGLDVAPWQLGLMLSFIGSFFSARLTQD